MDSVEFTAREETPVDEFVPGDSEPLDEFKRRLGPRTPAALQLLEQTPARRLPLQQRADLLADLLDRCPARTANALFTRSLELTPEGGELKATAEAARRVAAHCPELEPEQARAALGHLVVDLHDRLPGPLRGPAERVYLSLLTHTGSAEDALQGVEGYRPLLELTAEPRVIEAWGRLLDSEQGLPAAEIVELLRELTPEQQEKKIDSVLSLSQSVGSVREALPLVDFEPERAAAAVRAARVLSLEKGSQRLLELGLTAAELESVAKVQAPPRPWTAEGKWAVADTPIGRGWTDSPGGDYGNRDNFSLTTDPIDLRGLRRPQLELTCAHATEHGNDACRLEASTDGEKWRPLAWFTGNSQGALNRQIDLSRFEGEELRLRFRMISDGSTTADGFHLTKLSLSADDESGQTVVPFFFQEGGEPAAELLDGLEKLPQEARGKRLLALADLAKRLGSLRAATWLAAGLEQDEQAPELARLARGTDLETAARIWPLLDKGELAEEVQFALDAWKLSNGAGREELALELIGSGLTREDKQAVSRLARGALTNPWESTGGWGRETDPDGSLVWSDSPGRSYHSRENDAIETPFLDTSGLAGLQLRYQGRHELESGADRVRLELSTDGREWKTLRSHTGDSRWKEERVSLEDYQGQRIKLRFRLTSDGSTQKDGFFLRGLSLIGTDGERRTRSVFRADDGRADNVQTVKLIAERPEVLPALEILTRKLGSLPAAVSLVQKGQPEEVAEIAAQVGVKEAVELEGSPDLVLACHALAAEASLAENSLTPPPEVTAARLVALRPSQEELGLLRKLVDHLGQAAGGWTREGRWGFEEDQVKGRVLADSPGGNYSSNSEASLVSPKLDLRELESPRLDLELRYDLESRDDYAFLEIETEPDRWDRLARYTGQAGWHSQDFDLSAYRKRPVRFRLRLKADNSTERDGLAVARFEVTGSRPEEAVPVAPLRFESGGAPFTKLVDRMEATAPENRIAMLESLLDLTRVTGDTNLALEVAPEQAPAVALLGVQGAKAMEGLDPHFGSLALRLHRLFDAPLARDAVKNTALELERMELGTGALARLVAAAESDRATGFPPTGWGWEKDPVMGTVWSDSPGAKYSARDDNSLELGPFSLGGASEAHLKFFLKHQLARSDSLRVEIATPESDWQKLESYSGESRWREHSLDLDAYRGRDVRLRFRLHSDNSSTAEGASLARLSLEMNPRGDKTREIYRFDPGQPELETLLEALWARREVDTLLAMREDLGGLGPALTVWPLLEKASSGEDLELVREVTVGAGPLQTRRLLGSVIGRELPEGAADRLVGVGRAIAGWELAQDEVDWLGQEALRADLEPELKALDRDEAPQVVSWMHQHGPRNLGLKKLLQAFLSRQVTASEGSLEERLEALRTAVNGADIEIGQEFVDVAGQQLPIN